LIGSVAETVHSMLEGFAAGCKLVKRFALQNRRVERGTAKDCCMRDELSMCLHAARSAAARSSSQY